MNLADSLANLRMVLPKQVVARLRNPHVKRRATRALLEAGGELHDYIVLEELLAWANGERPSIVQEANAFIWFRLLSLEEIAEFYVQDVWSRSLRLVAGSESPQMIPAVPIGCTDCGLVLLEALGELKSRVFQYFPDDGNAILVSASFHQLVELTKTLWEESAEAGDPVDVDLFFERKVSGYGENYEVK